ncbi:MAG: DNA polymerase III subunit delta [Lachnospiraceae bacterium]|nr:DNA polymerase III subunit delta [Lachnospiraceae bacterium]
MGTWDRIPGQEKLKDYFTRAVEQGQISHAYILEGEPGTPGRELAEAFARMLQCEKRTGCGDCPSCRAFDEGNHPDVIRVSHEKPDVIRVNEIREQLVDDMGIRPYRGPYKIYLVDEAEKLNMQAQNALLKTLEEPPGYGVILLITVNAGALLPTIRSRSICLELASGGSGLELLEEEQRRQILSVLKKASDCDRTELAAAAAEWKEAGIPFRLVLHLIRVWFRDILVWKDLGQDRFLILKEEVRAVREAAERYSYPALQRILELTDRTERRIASNVNYELAMELLLAALRVPEKQEER